IKEMNDEGFYTYTGTRQDWSGSRAIFENGQAMFLITSTADLGIIREAAAESGMDFTTGRLPIPDGSERNGVIIGGASLWVSRDHPQEELAAAVDFALYMTDTENMVDWSTLTGYYPVRNSSVDVLEEEGYFEQFPENTVAFRQLLDTQVNSATAGALMGTFEDTRIIIEEAIQRVLGGGEVDRALSEAKAQADARLQEYNANFPD
nr:extracellular solute-binding protein [Deinococcota bacterium]